MSDNYKFNPSTGEFENRSSVNRKFKKTVKEKKKSIPNSEDEILSNWLVQLFILTLVFALINHFVWTGSLIRTIFETLDLSKVKQIRFIKNYNDSPIKGDLIIGFTFSCVISLARLLFEGEKGKKKTNDEYEDD
jgi:hypothetical protein